MEGGKEMKVRIIFKSLFVTLLLTILVGLLFIIFDKAGTRAHVYSSSMALVDYTIVYEGDGDNSVCLDMIDVIYEDDKYIYYFSCASSYDIYLVWSDGEKDLLKDAIRNKKVTMDSLIEHGLNVNKSEKER